MHYWHWEVLNHSRFALRRYTVKALGVFTVVAAGNHKDNACNYEPACRDDVITVGAYDVNHNRAAFSNYGNCVDAWGPGEFIWSSKACEDASLIGCVDNVHYGIDRGT